MPAPDPTSQDRSATVRSYDADARAFAAATAAPTTFLRALVDAFAARLGAGARVLEVGSGGGRDALLLEERGLLVRRTDISAGFVELLRGAGHEADLLDPLTDQLDDPRHPGATYDAVWAAASLLHVDRDDLPTVLARLAAVTRPDGWLHLSLKEGDGARWSTHGSVGGPRHFTYWREDALRAATASTGWEIETVLRRRGRDADWLVVAARREQEERAGAAEEGAR